MIPDLWRGIALFAIALLMAVACARQPGSATTPVTQDTAISTPDRATISGRSETKSHPRAAGASTSKVRPVVNNPSSTTVRSQTATAPTTGRSESPSTQVADVRTNAGGPAAGRRVPAEFQGTAELGDVHFEFDRATLSPAGMKTLDKNAEWIRKKPDQLVLIEGHCDDRGTNEYNLALGERRARAAMNYLVTQGVPAARMATVSYGEERPACREASEACWARNRRAHFLARAQ